MSDQRKKAAGAGRRSRIRTLAVPVGLVAAITATVAGFKMASAGSPDTPDTPRSPDGVTVHTVPEPTKDVGTYWTEERMRNAEPL
ncbi:hypothetical protein [Streptomyces scopuliridis]|uniref:Uncharacterized protein n=1 Tax=Streptomyces scopuliridis RB72 TaxID=1440053 RepID=A0A2T7SWC4_9ACTN|nr:hypothetical protein [Streptomyces scopuliridis]PVE07197.1 hypothetical protein Y717_24170 [Streptomyces scopuliridis RB72]